MSYYAKSNRRLKIITKLPIQCSLFGPQFGATTKQTLHLTMSSYLLACTRCKKKFKNQRALTQHQRKLTMCQANKMPNVSYNLASGDAPATTALLAFTRVDLAKRCSEMAKSSTRKANLPLGSTKNGQKTFVDSATDDATLDQYSRLESDSEDDFEPSMLNNEGDDVATTPVAVSQPGGVLTSLTLIGSLMIGFNMSNEHLSLLL